MLKHIRISEIYKHLITAVILMIPLYPKFPLFRVPGTYVSVRLEDFLILLSVIVIGIMLRKEVKKLLKNYVFYAIMLFFLAGSVSYISSVFVTQTVDWKIGLFHLLRRFEYISMFVAGYLAVKNNPNESPYFLRLFTIILPLLFIYGFGQRYFNWPIIITQNEEYAKGVALRYVEGSHINSTFAGHYDLATYLVFILPLVLSLVITSARTLVFVLPSYIGGLWLLVNTASRISLVSFIIAATTALLLQKKLRKGFLLIFLSILFIGFSSNLISRYRRVVDIFYNTVKKHTYVMSSLEVKAQTPLVSRRETQVPTPTPLPVFEDRSTSIRLNVEWPRAIRAFLKNPILGTGYSSITLATDNDYLRLLGETGILGTLSFVLIFLSLGKSCKEYLKNKIKKDSFDFIFITSLIGGFTGVLINAIFIDVFEASKFAITFWLLAGMGYRKVSM